MLLALGAIGLVVLGVLIGRYPDLFWRNSGLLLSGPRWIFNWLFERVKRNPQVCGAFFSGFFAGLLVSGKLNELFWNAALVGLLFFCLFIFFPATGTKIMQAVARFTSKSVTRVREFFA